MKTSDTAPDQATSLLLPAGLQHSDRLKRKAESTRMMQRLTSLVASPTKGHAWQSMQ